MSPGIHCSDLACLGASEITIVFRIDAMLKSLRDKVPASECNDGCPVDNPNFQATTIFSRPPHLIDSKTNSTIISYLARRIILAIGTAGTEDDGTPEKDFGKEYDKIKISFKKDKNGTTSSHWSRTRVGLKVTKHLSFRLCVINRRFIAPLLHSDLTGAERLLHQMHFAKTVSRTFQEAQIYTNQSPIFR